MKRFFRSRLALTLAALVMIAAVIAIPLSSNITRSHAANQTTPPVYAHSWYINNPSNGAMYSMGVNEANWANSHCGSSGFDEMVVLDFGQVAYQNGSYGTYDFAAGYPFISDSQIITAAEFYMQYWYLYTSSCPRLHLVMGVNNYHQCPFGYPCNVYTAGQQWANVVNTLNSWLSSQNYAWQITTYGGDDMETGYDSFSKTKPFVDGFNANDTSYAKFMDFGDAWGNYPNWTDANVYYVAWGAAYDYPLPEIYDTSGVAANRWVQIRTGQGYMYFNGVMTECKGSDPLPSSNCWVINHYESAPSQSWWQLWNTLNSKGVGQPSLDYTTNIKYQGT